MLDPLRQFAAATWAIWLEAAPWLLLGLLLAGLLKALLPTALIARWLGGRGVRPIVTAAVIGTPAPLCSCSVVPAALALRRGGASRGSTVSFLIATPENGVDSIALSYALLGPFMTVVRPVAAIISAVAAGLTTQWVAGDPAEPTPAPTAAQTGASSSCCASQADAGSGCCGASGGDEGPQARPGLVRRSLDGLRYAMTDLFDDIALWLVIGVLLAGAVASFAPPDVMSTWGSGLGAMLAMLAIGVPMYICATASTPVAAAMLLAGVSPGTVLVFLLAGPATNLGTLGIVRRELGTPAAASYLGAIAVCSVALGLATDAVVGAWGVAVAAQASAHHELIPAPLAWATAIGLGLWLLRPAWKAAKRRLSRRTASRLASPASLHISGDQPAPAASRG